MRVRAIDGAEEDWEVLAWVVAAASELGPGPMLDLDTIRGWFRERIVHEGVVDRASVERDARTDPCPCGIGRKYNKCCGAG